MGKRRARRPTAIRGIFWNLGGQDCRSLLSQGVRNARWDLIALTESAATPEENLAAIRGAADEDYFCPLSATPRLQVFARSRELGLEEVYGTANGRLTIRTLRWQGVEFLFAVAHLMSKLYADDADQYAEAQELARQIRDEETRRLHRRTILVGDLNMNPFERGVVQAAGLHAMMTKADTAAGTRIVQTKEYPFFYNPMWGLFGDRTPGPPGSYYLRNSQHLSYDWNILDQFLIRPEALEWCKEDVQILTRMGEASLVDAKARPNHEVASDHFPVTFALRPRRQTRR